MHMLKKQISEIIAANEISSCRTEIPRVASKLPRVACTGVVRQQINFSRIGECCEAPNYRGNFDVAR